MLCLVALFVAALLNVTGAQAAPRDSGSLTVEPMSANAPGYWTVSGWGYIKNLNSSRCMGVAGGDTDNGVFSVQWTCHQIAGSDQQMFIFPVGSDGIWHTISPEHSDKCMAISAARTTPGTSLIQWDCLGGHAEQQFAFWGTSRGNVEIIVRHSGQYIGVSAGHTGNGGRIIQWTRSSTLEQRWALI